MRLFGRTAATYGLLSVGFAFGSFGCQYPSGVKDVNAPKGRSALEWVRQPNDVGWNAWNEPLDRLLWSVVPTQNELEAEKLLRTAAVVSLSQVQVAELVPGKTAKGLPFLVRGISTTWATKNLEIHTGTRGELWVQGGALSHHPVPIERCAVVVWLEKMPTQVYATFSVAE